MLNAKQFLTFLFLDQFKYYDLKEIHIFKNDQIKLLNVILNNHRIVIRLFKSIL